MCMCILFGCEIVVVITQVVWSLIMEGFKPNDHFGLDPQVDEMWRGALFVCLICVCFLWAVGSLGKINPAEFERIESQGS